MGEVYRALDLRLDRTVAIKVLPQQLSTDPQRRERFQREAKTISGLSHAHICALYDIGEENGLSYLVLEYIEGESLAERLRRGPLPMAEVLKTGAEIASALEVAHRHGIVHRDLKPANVMLTKSGAKLLDFGLAKPAPIAAAASADAATLARSLTEEGTIVGTFQYMAPEQLEGGEADPRSDIFGLGSILYEMATGTPRLPRQDARQPDRIHPVLRAEARRRTGADDATELRAPGTHLLGERPGPALPVGARCAAGPELDWRGGIADGGRARHRAPAQAAGTRRMAGGRRKSSCAVDDYASVVPAARTPTPTRGPRFLVPRTRLDLRGGASCSLSRRRQTRLPPDRREQPALVPAIARIRYREADQRQCQNPLAIFLAGWQVCVAGGQVITIADAGTCGDGSWNADGTIIFGGKTGVMKVSSGGGTPELAIANEENGTFFAPTFLPDGRHFLMAERKTSKNGGEATQNAIFLGDLKTESHRILLQTSNGSGFVVPVSQYAEGFLVYVNQGNLMAQPFDPAKLRLTGDAIALGPIDGLFGLSPAGVLAYFAPGEASRSEIRWVGRSGQQLGPASVREAQQYDNVRLSPDGTRVAYQVFSPTTSTPGTIWVYDITRGVSSRVTFDNDVIDDRPVWSPDGKYILYNRFQDNTMRRVLSSGLGGEESVLEKAYPDDWSSDGKWIAYDTGTPAQIGLYDVAAKKGSVLLNVKSANHDARFSPDTRFLAYTGDESGQEEIYVVPIPGLTQKWQVSTNGGTRASWRRDGKELFYISPDQKLMGVSVVRNGDNLEIGKPVELFQGTFELTGNNVGRPYDPSPDGQKFIINSAVETKAQPLTLVTNWTSLVKK
jgi:Tol biopolymer transport system component